MGIGASILLIAIGAILTFGIQVETEGVFNIDTIGIILMIAGAIGALLGVFVWGPRRTSRRETIVDDRPPRGREVREERETY